MTRQETPSNQPEPAIDETTEKAQLTQAVHGLLQALESCAGDPPDCPHCGPARQFAANLLSSLKTHELPPGTEGARVSFTGRAGADATFQTTRGGTLVGRFSLAVRGEGRSTTWYPVLAFNHRAEALKDVATRGEALNVVGYLHFRESRQRDGTTRTVRQVHAVSVTKIKT